MDRDGAVTAMAERGFTAEQNNMGGWHSTGRVQWRVEFRKPGPYWSRSAVRSYFIEGTGLTCMLVDGLLGPQVTHEGIRPVGHRSPPRRWRRTRLSRTRSPVSPGGDLSVDSFEIELGAQRAGDTVVTWSLFFNTREIAGTSWDIPPQRSGTTNRASSPRTTVWTASLGHLADQMKMRARCRAAG